VSKSDNAYASATAEHLKLGARLRDAESKIEKLSMRLAKLEKVAVQSKPESAKSFRQRVLAALGGAK
jgi:hypothetical protein